VIRKNYALSVSAVLLIPVITVAEGWAFAALDPERAAGHPDYAHNFALREQLRSAALFGSLALECVLFFFACWWLLRAKSRTPGWMAWALVGAPGFAVIASLRDLAPLRPQDHYERLLARVPLPLRVLYEAGRFFVFWFAAMSFVTVWGYASALLEAAERGLTLTQLMAERDASSGMWAFGDLIRAAWVFIVMYALWPGVCNVIGGIAHRLGGGAEPAAPPAS
jgi:hypothetical protein